MIEISFGKLLVLALIALIVLGPEKLPAAARTAGALLRRVRGGWDSVRAEVERELQVDEIRRTAREAVAHMDAAQTQLDATLQQVRDVSVPSVEPSSADVPLGEVAEVTDADTASGDLFAGTIAAPAQEPSRDRV
ncbi:MAG: Sec-independent protein translocase protein TatB [Rhodanobacter sp.]